MMMWNAGVLPPQVIHSSSSTGGFCCHHKTRIIETKCCLVSLFNNTGRVFSLFSHSRGSGCGRIPWESCDKGEWGTERAFSSLSSLWMELEVSARGRECIGFPRGDPGVSLLSPPPHSRQDQEEQGQCEVQGALQPVPLHPGHHRQGEGREAEAVPAPRSGREGAEVSRDQLGTCWILCVC